MENGLIPRLDKKMDSEKSLKIGFVIRKLKLKMMSFTTFIRDNLLGPSLINAKCQINHITNFAIKL